MPRTPLGTSLPYVYFTRLLALFVLLLAGSADAQAVEDRVSPALYRSPSDLVTSDEQRRLYVTDRTRRSVVAFDLTSSKKKGELPLGGVPNGIALSQDGQTLFVSLQDRGQIAVIASQRLEITSWLDAGRWPGALAVSHNRQRLYVCDQAEHRLLVIDLRQHSPNIIASIDVAREPSCVALSPDEKQVLVTGLLPSGRGTDPELSADVSLVDADSLSRRTTFDLPSGSTLIRSIAVDPTGRWAYAIHNLGRFNLPVTQLDRGWVSTYALSVLDLQRHHRVTTLLLDDVTQGAADPYAIVCSHDGTRLWISHSGVHEISQIDIGLIHEMLAGRVPQAVADRMDGERDNIWVEIRNDPRRIDALQNDLSALYIASAIRRYPVAGRGPRGLALSNSGRTLYIANYYSGTVTQFDTKSGNTDRVFSLGGQPAPDSRRRGEMVFHDASLAFQRWHSCASCHPNSGRVDGLRWDFLGDGIGNPKDTLSLVWLNHTTPLNRRATRATPAECARTGIQGAYFVVPTDEQVQDVAAYMTSLQPLPSPFLTAEGKLSSSAKRGKAVFEGKAGCSHCHAAPYFTNRKMYNVGVLSENEPDGKYDTPSLVEGYRTAPYLHDGRARTLTEVLTIHNPQDRHGKTSELTDDQVADLVAYLMSL